MPLPRRRFPPYDFLACLGLTGLVLGGLLIGFEPVGGDPDRMYRPLKQELARLLGEGRLPWWSDRFGLGLPLLAESHVAGLYPPNWALYSVGSMPWAYRLSMWSHYLLLAASTYGYARFLGASSRGAALAAVAFPFCGFQAIHSSHEPFYHALAYVPLTLLAAEWYLAARRTIGLFLVAGLWALQLTLGHFQLQWWTGGLVVFLALWRVLFDGRDWRRAAGLGAALALGTAAAAVQLGASWELADFVGHTNRSAGDLAFYGFPPEHWAEVAIPGLVRGIPGGPEAGYWYGLGTTGYEACFYVGTIPLILFLLRLARGAPRPLAPWLVVILVSLGLAMLPRAWPSAQALIVRLPGFGWFRAPGRYVVLASLGIVLVAACGLDEIAQRTRNRPGWWLVVSFALAAGGWSAWWCLRPANQPVLGGERLALAMGTATLTWCLSGFLLVGWQRRRVGGWVLLLATVGELGALYYTSTTVWGWAVTLPGESRMLARLGEEPDVGRVAGLLHNLPVRAGVAPLYPYTGFALPPPHPYLDLASRPGAAFSAEGQARLLRHGATHGLWDRPGAEGSQVDLLTGPDPVLDRLVVKPPGSAPRATWKLVRYLDAFPLARAAIRTRVASRLPSLISGLDHDPDPQTVWFLAGDRPPTSELPTATAARVVSFDGTTAVVEHDGSCDLILNRTFYPGWHAAVNGRVGRPVTRAELGLQRVHLPGQGISQVVLKYRPGYLRWAWPTSMVATGLIVLGLGLGGGSLLRAGRLAARPQEPDRQEGDARDHRLGRGVKARE